MVDLFRVAHQDDFTAFPGSGDNRLHLVAGEILRLIDDDELRRNGTSADIGECLNLNAAQPH
ncbi:hypothetical protein D3C74_477270 [compost metagenome]